MSGVVLAVRLLGALEVTADGRTVEVTARRLQALVAVLALSPGRTVSLDRIAAAVWGQDAPVNVRSALQTYVTRLRTMLGSGTIAYDLHGYVLNASPEHVDVARFVGLLDTASTTVDPAAERRLLSEALALWRGIPFQGLRSAWLDDVEGTRLVERYLAATERHADLAIDDGRAAGVLPRLQELTSRYPLRESLRARLLVALDRSGRPAEALAGYELIRARISDELGVDPGPELQGIYRDLLNRVYEDGYADTWSVVPHQLPADIDVFAGRRAALDRLDEVLHRAGSNPQASAVAVISGMAGVGKTTLARHWAHRVLGRFGDGQLYVNLRGYDPSRMAVTPTDALYGFLGALGVPAKRIPAAVDVQAALYRSLTAGRRFLVILDNAADADQVRPLLPGDGCLAVVTSRDRLAGLVIETGAHAVVLDPVPADEAWQLLARRIDVARMDTDPAAVGEIITVCAGLPLALAIVATRAAIHGQFPLGVLADQLREARTSLDELATADDTTNLRAVFSWSYDALPVSTARLFRLLGLHPCPDIGVPAAASIAGLPQARVRPMLARLAQANLLLEHRPGRFAFHDLLCRYAVELAHLTDTDDDRRAATHRMLDHYLHTAYTADGVLDPGRTPLSLVPARPGVVAEKPAGPDAAMAWFAAEHPVLIAMVEQAYAAGYDTHTWQIAWSATDFLARQGHWQDWAATQRRALDAVTRLADGPEQARAHRGLARAYTRLGRLDEAHAHLREALDLYTDVKDRSGLARTHQSIADLLDREGRYAEVLDHLELSQEHCLAIGDHSGQARVLNARGWTRARLGDYEEARVLCELALSQCQELAYRSGEAGTWDSLGYIHHHRGDHAEAIRCYQESIAIFRELGDRFHEAETLARLGDTHHCAGDDAAARGMWRRAADILDETHHPDAGELRARLAALDA